MNITKEQAILRLKEQDDILILSHHSPDGDTLGCGFGLYYALTAMGKRARLECSDAIPEKFAFMAESYQAKAFEPKFVVAVDVAAIQLLGKNLNHYAERVDLCIDHHPSNEMFAKETYLVPTAAAACEIVYEVICGLGVAVTPQMASCLYTGISTDSGCFRYSNTTENTHRIAANLFSAGAKHAEIDRIMFETKSKSRIKIEQQALNSIEYFYEDKVAIIGITQKMIEQSGADEAELDGVSSIPRTIEGVEIGITIREKQGGAHKISVRTTEAFDASQLCAKFDGGGHKRAAGCLIEADYDTAKAMIVEAIETLI